MNSHQQIRGFLALFGLLMWASCAQASSAGFKITAEGVELGQPVENDDVPRYHVKLKAGQTATFIAQGIVSPRGGKDQASEPDAAAWLFDDAALQLVPHEKKKYDKTKFVVTLKGLKPGESRVRFVGNILGYERKFDVMVEVIGGKE